MIKKISKLIGLIFLIILVAIVGLLAYMSASEYKPPQTENLTVDNQIYKTLKADEELTLMTWNVGFGALGQDADFFMDGGTTVLPSDEDLVNKNMDAIVDKIQENDPDFLMLQEVDRPSKRSYGIDEVAKIQGSFDKYSTAFANNFKVNFIPYPVPPLGKVDSGLLSLSKYQVTSATRESLPVPFKWPVRTVNLKRCMLAERIPLEGSDKELILLNVHLEAYDSGEGKILQTNALNNFIKDEIHKGNYVIAGGDFNQGFDNANDAYGQQEGLWAPGNLKSSDMSKDLKLMMDPAVPSCRSLDSPYTDADHDTFQYYMLDGYIISNNIHAKALKTLDYD
ncbi:MAG: endonuclease/exonuclease/phosphatase family protein, partial [Bacillota bacterium]|nr:endonuclease/exonuclease/phosphatase family protein [Bacillota bacterium]